MSHWQQREIVRSAGGCCYLCWGPLRETSGIEIDHIVPISRGGGGGTNNLAAVHRKCNRMKGARLVSELSWIGYREHEWGDVRS